MDSINEKIYKANIQLQDENKVLKQDKKILQKRIENATEYIEYLINQFEHMNDKELITNRMVDINYIKELKKILKGEYFNER